MQAPAASPNAAEVIDRIDLPRNFLNTAWPLAAAALTQTVSPDVVARR